MVEILLCGEVAIERDGRRLDAALRSRQARLLLAYLVLNRGRAVSRDELIDAVWQDNLPPEPRAALSVLLSKLRAVLGQDAIAGRDSVRLTLPAGTSVDLERLTEALQSARAQLAESRPRAAWLPAGEALEIASRGFMAGYDAPWIEDRRAEVEEWRLAALECRAAAGVSLGRERLGDAEAAARSLIEGAPFRESGYRYLMEVHALRGNHAEGLQVYDLLRRFLSEEIGAAPSAAVRGLHERLLAGEITPAVAMAPGLPAPLAEDRRTAFVGRSGEMEALEARLEEVAGGNRRLVLLAGEPGIGKTRLAAEFAVRAHARGATVLYGRCFDSTLLSYEAFVVALQHYVASCPADVLRAQVGREAAELARLLPELRERIPELPQPISGDPEGERYRAFEAVGELLARASAAHPLVLILDDLHWADRGTLALLRHVVRFRQESGVLLLGTYRATELTPEHPLSAALVEMRRDGLVESLPLAGLSEEEVDVLVEALAAGGTPAGLARELAARTAGNPFFVSEVVRHMVETGGLGIPPGVKDVVSQRVARLGDALARVLKQASVLGREFELDVLARLAEMDPDALAEALESAVAAGLVDEVQGQVGRYRFSHALVHDALVESLSITRRVRLHRQAAEAVESLPGADDPSRLAALAHHYLEATPGGGVTDKAVHYARRAGDAALASLAYEEAAAHFERALAALDDHSDPELRCELLLAAGHARARTHERVAARYAFHRAADLARAEGAATHLARAALAYGTGYPQAGIVDHTLVGLLEDALARLPDHDSALRARALGRLGQALYFSDERERSRELTEAGLAMAQRIADREALASVLACTTFWGPGELDRRTAVTRELISLASELGDKELVLLGHHWNSCNLLETGDRRGAEDERAAGDRIAEELRQPFLLRFTARWRVLRALLEGDLGNVERLAAEAFAIGERAQLDDATQIFAIHLALLQLERGNGPQLIPGIRQYAEQFPTVPTWRCALVMLHAQAGDEESARAELEPLAAGRFAGIPEDAFWLAALSFLSAGCALLGDVEHAASLHDLLAPYAERVVLLGDGACIGPVAAWLGVHATTLERWEQAEHWFAIAAARAGELGSPPISARVRTDLAAMLLARGQEVDRGRAEGLLAQAATTADRLDLGYLRSRIARLSDPAAEQRTG